MRISPINNNYLINNKFNNNAEMINNGNDQINTPASNNNINFKGGKESTLGKWIAEFYGKHYAKPMYDKKWIQSASEKMTKFPGSMTEHMTVLGSILTSSVYMYKTLKNHDLDKEKRKTLAINQGLCCLIPTIGAYTISSKMAKFKKNIEYTYRGLKEQQVALGQLDAREAEALKKSLGNKLKGLNALTGLITFTLIYRYVTPVIVTPIANMIGNKIQEKNAAKPEEKATEVSLEPKNKQKTQAA